MDDKLITIGLAQINNSFSGQCYLPYSVGLLQSYVVSHAKDPDKYSFLLPIFRRMQTSDAVNSFLKADIVGFSAYVWNVRASLEIARQLKARSPKMFVIFGGPQVPDKAEQFLRSYPFIDVACHGEGEETFLQLIEAGKEGSWDEIPGISFLNKKGEFITNIRTRRRDIEVIPSPYLAGAFDSLIEAYPDMTWIGLWETNRGCPFKCTFCDWGSATQTKVLKFDMDRLYGEVDWFANHKLEFVFTCDANFGILPRDVDLANYVADSKNRTGYPKALSVQNTKNATERAYTTQKILADAGLNKGVALSLQSTNPEALEYIKRDNISLDSYRELQRRFAIDGVETYTDLILSLPGETYETFANGVSDIIESGQHNRIQFNNLSILPNSEMGDPEYLEKYGMRIAEAPIINLHGRLEAQGENVQEMQQLVVETAAMPASQWIRTRTFSWLAAFLHFNKVMHIPFIILNQTLGLSYREQIEAFVDADSKKWPLLAEVSSFFSNFAKQLQLGGDEYVYSEDWLQIFWPADEYMYIKLSVESRLTDFYAEAEGVLMELVNKQGIKIDANLLHDAVKLNYGLLSQPGEHENIELNCKYDVLGYTRAIIYGHEADLEPRGCCYLIKRSEQSWANIDDWCREVVWYGNKKGAYLYDCVTDRDFEAVGAVRPSKATINAL